VLTVKAIFVAVLALTATFFSTGNLSSICITGVENTYKNLHAFQTLKISSLATTGV
jgi:hypothetical protein